MGLEQYRDKRDFTNTPEPSGDQSENSEQRLSFIIHLHQATHLHYDLRLELDGVLKSWAVPKGPSLNPTEKRLAMMVEDHPFDYRNFEGVIPEGNYGAGSVIIWDEGTYYVPGIGSKKENENLLRDSLARGNLFFFLEGEKIRGSFHLVRLKNAVKQNSWLLIKKEDSFATYNKEITSNNRSVRTGRSLEQISKEYSNRNFHQIDITSLDLSGAQNSPFPPGPLKPMLAQLVEEPFDLPGWVFEIKWDGYRALAQLRNGSVQLYSRHGKSYLNDYPPVVDDLKSIKVEAVIDGEIIVADQNGRAVFSLLQQYRNSGRGNLIYYVFDILFLEGYDLRRLPLTRRKSLLKEILPALPHIRYSDHIEQFGKDFFRLVKEQNLEGMMAKDGNSIYLNGMRSRHWQKIKTHQRQEFVIGGFTEPRGTRSGIGALLVGYYENGDLKYAGSVGGGFTNDELPRVREMLSAHSRNGTPFINPPKTDTLARWTDPVMVCEVKFAEWTTDRFLRQPVFLGFREDIEPAQVRRELPVPTPGKATRFDVPKSPDQYEIINGRTLKLTNLNKIYWPRSDITKGDTINYYRQIASIILPHLMDRPESLHRFPDGIEGKEFFHKDMVDAPPWAQLVRVESDTQQGQTAYFLCQDEASLVYMVNLGALEINPWNSRVGSLDYPDYMVIDLDPLHCEFDDVITTAQMVHEILSTIDIPHYPKTSGATGIHIFVPLGGQYTYEQARQFSAIICSLVNRKLPSITSLERLPEKRRGRVYLDFLQNTKGKTMAVAYSLRPRPGAPVSTPLRWDEINHQLKPEQFSINNIRQRLDKYGDLWKPVLGKGIDMKSGLNALARIYDLLPES